MANDILNSEIFQTQKTEKKTISSKPTTEIKKEGNSLFDSLLKDAKIKAGSSEEINKSQINNNVQKEVIEPTLLQNNQKNEKYEKIVEQKINLTTLQSKSVTTLKTDENLKSITSPTPIQANSIKVLDSNKEKIIENKTDKIVLPTSSKSSVLSEKVDTSKIEEISSKTQKTIQKETIADKGGEKVPLSLLDRMLQDLKKDTQIDNQNLTKVVLDKGSETSLNKVSKENSIKENKVTKKEIVIEDKGIKTVDEKTKSSINTVAKNTKEEPVKDTVKANISSSIQEKKDLKSEKETVAPKIEIPSQKILKQTSLLDKMVQEIDENSSIEESEEKKEIKKISPKTIVKSDQNVGKLFVELSDGIQLENTQKKSTFEINDTKETKILSSLADSLSGKTKIQKRVDETTKLESLQDGKGQFGANLFLSNQKVQAEILSKQKLTEANEVLKDGEKTTKTVKKTADILELKATKIEVITEADNSTLLAKTTAKTNDLGIHNQQTFLNRMFLNKENSEQIMNTKLFEEKIVDVKTVNDETKKINSDVSITVEKNLLEAFTTKVIASKQAMGSFMSDVARNMYLNYKPPITAFKINLDPINLGNIAIVMKSNKSENTLNISLNMSQNGTYETFNDNKSTLQNALAKVFNQNEGNISLDFGMQSDSSNQSFEQQREEQENKQIIQNRTAKSENVTENELLPTELETLKSYM